MIKKTLLLYKKSSYTIYFMERKNALCHDKNTVTKKAFDRLIKSHDEHYAALKKVQHILHKYKVAYDKCCRGNTINYAKYDLVITVGGDGTFLEAARKIKNQIIVGVNSSLSYSVGKLCAANTNNFELFLSGILDKSLEISIWPRLRLQLEERVNPIEVMNDMLICHGNPAAMSRYILKIKGVRENQRSSGLWISTSSGSTGAIHSAGGKTMAPEEKNMQYRPRELCQSCKGGYRLTGDILTSRQKISVTSLMRKGMIFIDGTHVRIPFDFGLTAKIGLSPTPIRTVKL